MMRNAARLVMKTNWPISVGVTNKGRGRALSCGYAI